MYRVGLVSIGVIFGAACSQSVEIAESAPAELPSVTPIETAKSPAQPLGTGLASSLDAAIETHLQRLEDNPHDFDVTSVKSADIWDFACGDIIPTDTEKPRQSFCALLAEREHGTELLEFEVIGIDAPYFDWFATHGVPESIIDQ